MNISKYNEKINQISERYESLYNGLTEFKDNNKNKNMSQLHLIKEEYCKEFQVVIQQLTQIIDFISSNEKKNEETKEEESPASIVRMLNLNWMPNDAVEHNVITTNNHTDNSASYWCVVSEETLNGSFLSKVNIEKIENRNPSYWRHNFGIIRKDRKATDNEYYNDSITFQSNGWLTKEFYGSGDFKKLSEPWKSGDTIILKRDTNNKIYFGVNDESDLQLAYEGISGEFKIVFGFSNSSKESVFRMDYLNICN